MILPTFDPGFTSPAVAAVLTPRRLVADLCRFEAALAEASAEAGLFDGAVAERITIACANPPDAAAVIEGSWEDGTPLVALLADLRGRLDADTVEWVHFGATTQDAVDTALMLGVREAVSGLLSDLIPLGNRLATIAAEQRHDPALAWTFLQPAVPTTVGMRVAGWLDPLSTHVGEAVRLIADLPVQLGGPTGTLADFGDAAEAVVEGLARRLSLVAPIRPWHTDRTIIRRVAALSQSLAATVATIAADLVLLAHHDLATMRAGGSSSMPGKRNPVDAVRALAAADACGGVADIITRARPHEFERAAGAWHAEWFALPQTLHTAGAAVHALGRAVADLTLAGGSAETGPTPSTGRTVDRVVQRWTDSAQGIVLT